MTKPNKNLEKHLKKYSWLWEDNSPLYGETKKKMLTKAKEKQK